ncbi:unnamed protein product [Merluccius merluccius]
MFIEDNDWNDDHASGAPSRPALSRTGDTSNGGVKFKNKEVGKKSLLRTLQTLGPAAPEQQGHRGQKDSDSDSEPEPESAPARPKKRKKKRNRGRKKTDGAEETEAAGLGDGGDGGDGDKKADNVPKEMKRKEGKMGSLKKTDSANGKSKVVPEKKEENELNRKQWKNKMKNRRKCKNKYREKELEVRKTDTATESTAGDQQKEDAHSGDNSKETLVKTASQNKAKQKDPKPPKRKLTEPAESKTNTTAVIQTLKQNKTKPVKNTKVKEKRVKTEATASPGREPNQADELPVEVEEDEEEDDDMQHATPSSKRQKMQKQHEESHKRERLRKMLHSQEPPTENQATEEEEEEEEGIEAAAAAPADRSASLRSRMEQRLEAARFRYINEVLYTSSSGEAKRMFSQDPQAFGVYHKGFTAQVQRWPSNPVDAIIAYIRKKPSSHVVADFGCGDCKIALSVKNKVHSFDLAPICKLVTVCDMANVPLKDGSVHIAVFCLSLMGTNLIDFLAEANRVLVMGGVLKIAEVASRFEDVRGFLTTLSNLGFKMTLKDTENSHFYSFDFLKTKDVSENMKSSRLELRPCVYKKR